MAIVAGQNHRVSFAFAANEHGSGGGRGRSLFLYLDPALTLDGVLSWVTEFRAALDPLVQALITSVSISPAGQYSEFLPEDLPEANAHKMAKIVMADDNGAARSTRIPFIEPAVTPDQIADLLTDTYGADPEVGLRMGPLGNTNLARIVKVDFTSRQGF